MGAIAPAAARALGMQQSDVPRGVQRTASARQESSSPREKLLMDFGWRFHFGNAADPAKDFGFGIYSAFAKTGEFCRPARHDFDDSAWEAIDLPHDFAVGLPFVDAPELVDFGFKPVGRNFPETSIGWYRRVFEIPQSDSGRRLAIEFDGVFRDAMVILNGIYLGRNLSGYAPFRFDITDFANYGGKNVLVVRVDATEHEGWFYEGAGIYRHVWLAKADPLHVVHWGACVRSETHGNAADVAVETEIHNEQDGQKSFRVLQTVFDASGKRLANAAPLRASLRGWGRKKIAQKLHFENARLWSLEDPHLYSVVTQIESEGKIADQYETSFGVREMHFDPNDGFFLNGKRVEVKGTCNHQDHAGVGSALPDRLQYFRIAKLKEMGANAYRTSHNPPTPELLDACDRLGMLVMDETRMFSSSREGLSQLERMVRRDRNHPCVFLWSMGNEEPLQSTPTGARMCAAMKRLVRRLDPSRPVTLAMNNSWGQGASAIVDVQGCNYFHQGNMDEFHAEFPQKPIIGSEDASALATRGIYANDPARGFMSAYDVNTPGHYAATAEEWWNFYAAHPFAAGAFAWTGFDYRGEPSPYKWPCISSQFGIMDTCGFPKDTYFYYQAWWSGKAVLHLFPHWNWPGREGQPIQVWVHGNCDEVELFLNGNSLGRKEMPRRGHLQWEAKYAPGILLARGYKSGRACATSKRETTGAPAAIKLTPDRAAIAADGTDVSVVSVAVLDAQKRIVPVAENEIAFQISGPGKIIGVGNGNPASHEPDKASRRKVFNGLAQVIVQSEMQAGAIELTACSQGLASAAITLQSQEPKRSILRVT